jgi:hypothetical protein
MRIDWGSPKITTSELETYLISYLGDQYDGLRFENNYLYVVTYTPLNEEQEAAIQTYIYNTNDKLAKVEILSQPFSNKVLLNGKSVYTRLHGITAQVSGQPDNIDFIIPYNNCKITGIEIINGEIGETVNMKVLDTPTGTFSGVPNYPLNQFAFNLNIAKDFYVYKSAYDADLMKDMQIRLEYDSTSTDLVPKTIYINFILHEIKD